MNTTTGTCEEVIDFRSTAGSKKMLFSKRRFYHYDCPACGHTRFIIVCGDVLRPRKGKDMKLGEAIPSEDRWTQGVLAIDDKGEVTDNLRDDQTIKRCLSGGLLYIIHMNGWNDEMRESEARRLLAIVRQVDPENFKESYIYCGVAEWNDDHATWPKIQEVIRRFDYDA